MPTLLPPAADSLLTPSRKVAPDAARPARSQDRPEHAEFGEVLRAAEKPAPPHADHPADESLPATPDAEPVVLNGSDMSASTGTPAGPASFLETAGPPSPPTSVTNGTITVRTSLPFPLPVAASPSEGGAQVPVPFPRLEQDSPPPPPFTEGTSTRPATSSRFSAPARIDVAPTAAVEGVPSAAIQNLAPHLVRASDHADRSSSASSAAPHSAAMLERLVAGPGGLESPHYSFGVDGAPQPSAPPLAQRHDPDSAIETAAVTRAVLLNAALDQHRSEAALQQGSAAAGVDPALTAGRTLHPPAPAGVTAAPDARVLDARQQTTNDFTAPVVRGLRAMIHHRGGAMTMRLDPPELGALRVQLSILGGSVSARFDADSLQAQALLRQHLPTLRHALEGQGLNVERLTVTGPPGPAAGDSSSSRAGSDQPRSDGRSFQHDAAQGESRGRHGHQHGSGDSARSYQRTGAFALNDGTSAQEPSP